MNKDGAIKEEMAWLVKDLEKGGAQLSDLDKNGIRIALEGAFIAGQEFELGITSPCSESRYGPFTRQR